MKRLNSEAAYRALLDSGRRRYDRFAVDQQGPRMRLFGPNLLKTYEAECKRKQAFIEEADETEQHLDQIAAAVRLITDDRQFRVLLVSEGLATMPKPLARRMQGTFAPPPPQPLPSTNESRSPVGGICPEVLDLLQDCMVPAKLFGLLRQVVPARQMEIARLMVALERVRFNYAKMLVALTPRSLLARDIDPRKEIDGLSEVQLGAMEPELGRLTLAFLSAMERRGRASLELVAASRYFERLMDNSRVVRYLAHNFPGHFEEFHNLSVPVLR